MRFPKFLALLLAFALTVPAMAAEPKETAILLSDSGVRVDGKAASTDPEAAVYVGADIVYYQDGTDETYGEGTAEEMHPEAEAKAHTVVTITRPGVYRLSGKLSKGQISIDLGEEAKDDPSAVVTVILDNADVTCTVAPALIFYNVYECDREFVSFDDDENPDYEASPYVDTADAGAKVILAENSQNTFTGSHVARIYKPGTEKKLHKYDGAFYSKMTMSISGDDTGALNIVADNEGLDSELHLTILGGNINITAQNDGINTNEDNVSVTCVAGGDLTINAGLGAEGDGIDSNGYLVVTGGSVTAAASDHSMDGGIDAAMPILIDGGAVAAYGVRNDNVENTSKQPYLELTFGRTVAAGSAIELRELSGKVVWSGKTAKSASALTISTPELKLDTTYHLYVNGQLQAYGAGGFGGFGGGRHQMNGELPQLPEGQEPPAKPEGEAPADGQTPPELPTGERPELPEGEGTRRPQGFGRGQREDDSAVSSIHLVLTADKKSFGGVSDWDGKLPFEDVAEDSDSYEAIKALYLLNVVEGDGQGSYYPDTQMAQAHWKLICERLKVATGKALGSLPVGATRAQAAKLAAE